MLKKHMKRVRRKEVSATNTKQNKNTHTHKQTKPNGSFRAREHNIQNEKFTGREKQQVKNRRIKDRLLFID